MAEPRIQGDAVIDMLLSKLTPHPRNYRTHPEDQIEHLIESISEYGFYRNIVIAEDGTILAGHGVAQAAYKMELKTVPVIRLHISPDDPRALKILAGDNEVGSLGERDDRKLAEMLKDINVEIGLLGTGFNEQMLAAFAMITRPHSEIADFDAAAEWVGMPEFESSKKPPQLLISFENEEDRQAFTDKYEGEISISYRKSLLWSGWWPPKDRQDLDSVRFDDQES